ncbi:MAG: hypothetical protein JXR37_33000 [Kiritimatiellae bacterium]|nr:hypothetical protein [Kiritimatiellia bacterium]
MDKAQLLDYLAKIDAALKTECALCVYGSGALILLDEPGRTSLDIDIAAPYSVAAYPDFCRAADEAGLPVNPEESENVEHVEWVSALRLCLAKPEAPGEVVLWQGQRLTLKTVSPADLVASKLIRYDEIDQGDIRYLVAQANLEHAQVREAVERLPDSFRSDRLVRENLANLEVDMKLWKQQEQP